MNHKTQTTEFSAHLSRSRMSRYLHQQLSAKEIREVEVHLMHCERCSEGILDHIQNEESQHNKIFQKQLKYKLKSKASTKKISLSTTQVKVVRATVALLLLFVFSFFGISTVTNHKVAVKEQPKAQKQVKKNLPAKKQNHTPLEEQRTGEVSTEEPSVSKTVSSSALALESSSDSRKTENSKKPSTTGKSVPKNTYTSPPRREATETTTAQPKTTAVSSKPEANNQTDSSLSESSQESEVKKPEPLTKVASQAQSATEDDEDEKEDGPVIQPLPKIEKLDIQKTEEKTEAEVEKPVIPTPGEVKLLQDR